MAEETQRVDGVSRDLMKRNHFSNQRNEAAAADDNDDDDGGEVELSLGLSMNGRFGVDPSSKKLRRSSSVSNLFLVGAAAGGGGGSVQARGEAREGHAPLGRTCSLPAETEEWRRSREIQSARCMEARKKRMEKLKNVRVGKEVQQYESNNNSSSEEDAAVNNNNCFRENLNFVQSSSQGSIGSSGGSAGGSSSGVPNFQTQLMIGGGRQNNPAEQGAWPAARGGGRQNNPPEQGAVPAAARGGGNDELVKNALLDMPYVSTRGFAPHFNKIEGFLYRYKKGEEVKIVCVCHGLFLSPAEFVKHGGGGDVAQPLKHIVVNPFPLF
ncbi:hypothetical protein ABFS82_11G118500 [Erythranthe guttata]|uniref:Ninja-family protein n=1 Tax=Erythranthe guttata TaxID=4155 RepID=A0A022R3Q9_ERYGU|nr:hypothetical protein MIMGU_mgv1a010027mg [Erythranthe guttata]